MFKKLLKKLLDPERRGQIRDEFESILGYRFQNRDLLFLALVHKSCNRNDKKQIVGNNERLEFLGDSVGNMIITHHLYEAHPDFPEGDLSKMKSVIVSAPALAQAAQRISLGKFIQMSPAEEKSGGRNRQNILADAFEAVIGAVYLDGGLENCQKIIEKELIPAIPSLLEQVELVNFKSLFLEYCQGLGKGAPVYKLVSESGPEHKKEFEVEAFIGEKALGKGTGSSKKSAEQAAAAVSLDLMKKEEQQLELESGTKQ